jgi:hypothetical protein
VFVLGKSDANPGSPGGGGGSVTDSKIWDCVETEGEREEREGEGGQRQRDTGLE